MLIQSIRNKTLTLVSLMAVAVVSGCGHSNDPRLPEEPLPDPDQLTLCLNVSFSGQEADTRADQNPDEFVGPTGDFETISTLRVIIVRDSVAKDENDLPMTDSNGNTIVAKRKVEANRLVATSPQGYPLYDNLEFEVIADENKRIYLVANESSLTPPANTTWKNATAFLDSYKPGNEFPLDYKDAVLTNWTVSLSDINHEYIDGTATDVTKAGIFASPKDAKFPNKLPLTEFFDIYADSSEAIDDIYTTNLFMTRAAAKANFYVAPPGESVSEAYANIKIAAIALSGIGKEEYVFPYNTTYSADNANYSTENKHNVTSKELEKLYITNFSTPSATTLTYYLDTFAEGYEDGVNIVGSDEEKSIGTMYFPESILASGQKYQVSVLLNTGTWLTAQLETNILSIDEGASQRDAIARNTDVRVTMTFTSTPTTPELNFEVDVAPYIGCKLDPSFGDPQDYPN